MLKSSNRYRGADGGFDCVLGFVLFRAEGFHDLVDCNDGSGGTGEELGVGGDDLILAGCRTHGDKSAVLYISLHLASISTSYESVT
ncbi:hypothetical protein M7I_3546 [Glarea lozoyensis 74030]|uniref:Uncharacterized protein n=1 Tax=Glarea lozoyensis (strain ATCC 74030 / MF5533) TaxID=1104152 RepID=H0ELS6_GLAL7|nr:hypothetical protein M7I_3546 [Glarea lozoyensis 74030]